MKFFELQESMACTPFLLHFLQILGLRRGGGHAGLLRFVGGLLAGWTVLWIPKAFFGFGDELDLNIRGYSELLFMFNIDARAIIFYLNIAKLNEFVKLVQNVFNQVTKLSPDSPSYTTVLKSNQALDRIAKTYVIFAAVAGVVFVIFPALQTIVIYSLNRRDGAEVLKYVTSSVHEQNGINVEEDIRLYFIHALLIAPVHVILGLKLAATDITIFCGIKSIGSIFRLVSTRLGNLHDFKNVDELRKELKEVVDIHNDALRCVKILESISSLGVMLQLMNTVIVWVAMVFCVSYSPNMNALNLLVLLILITSQTFLLCQYGNELTEESIAVATEAYNAQWAKLPVDVQKGVGLILQRAQKWEGITAARFYQVNVERFGAMVHTSYSIYVVLKDRLASKT
ncbi:odorant receptor 49b isoform X1 [Culex quinquefasciatus]|uniref:odorant receptor 49b isoform X1 n=1 Tax=Culex quinquefasciatus TaxID=7176 RepID=UPI0018E33822|nr:odorant receptor 49b isoform X1 [Culex quinquefasciatus]